MAKQQRRTFLILSLLGLVYFILFLYPNTFGAGSEEILLSSSQDEYVTYPNVLQILTPGETFNDTRANLFLYEDYHYGYPFYALSALVLLPVRLIYGSDMSQHMQLNLTILREMISLLPMILAAGVLVYLQTRFKSTAKSVALFLFLLTVRGVVRNHIWWWHPDALAVLFVVLTLFCLDRDRLRFGRYFYFAAFFCGLSIAIKLLGFFFFLTIGVYILAGLLSKQIKPGRAAFVSALFVLVMTSVTVFSNPFVFSKDQRARLVLIQTQKQEELTKGYEHDDPMFYNKGPQWWVSTLEKWYGSPLFLAFLLASAAAGCFWGERRLLNMLILTWVVPYSIYLFYFVAVKPDHYWLPVMLPLFSTAFTFVDLLIQQGKAVQRPFLSRVNGWQKAALVVVLMILVGQFGLNLARNTSGNIAIYRSAVQTGIAQK